MSTDVIISLDSLPGDYGSTGSRFVAPPPPPAHTEESYVRRGVERSACGWWSLSLSVVRAVAESASVVSVRISARIMVTEPPSNIR